MSCQVFRNEEGKIERVEAPNGNESILFNTIVKLPEIENEEEALKLWAQTYTPSFKKWFNNGVVDENGEPKLLFHGSNIDSIEEFYQDRGVFVTDNYQAAQDIYGDYVYPLFLNASNLEEKSIEDLDDNRNNLDSGVDKEYFAINTRDESMPITEYVVFDNSKIKSLFNDGIYEGANIYYHKSKVFKYSETEYKSNLSKYFHHVAVSKNGWVSADKYKGKRTIKHTFKNISYSGKQTPNQRLIAVNENKKRLDKFNDRMNNGVNPFIITKQAPTILKDEQSKTIEIPNYTVELNDEWFDIEWTKFSMAQEEINKRGERGDIDEQMVISFPETTVDQREIDSDMGFDNPSDLQDKLNILQRSFNNVKVAYNPGLPSNVYGRLVTKKGETPVVEINPRYVKKDTAIHEFGHLYIDLLGGMSNNFVKRGRKLLEGSDIETEVIANYATGDEAISGELLDKEILATAIGREGADLYDLQKSSPIKAWIKIALNKLKLILPGFKGNVALEMAQQMLNNKVDQTELTSELGDLIQQSKTMGYEEFSSKEDSTVTDMANKILERIKIIQAKYNKSNKANDKFKKEVEDLLTVLEEYRDAKGIIRYVDEAVNQLDKIYKRINSVSTDTETDPKEKAHTIKQIGTFLGAFNLIEDVVGMYEEIKADAEAREDFELLKIFKEKDIQTVLDDVSAELVKVNKAYSNLRRNNLAEILAPKSKRLHTWYRNQYEIKFYEEEGGYSQAKAKYGKDFSKILEKYIADNLSENADMIERAEKNYIKEILKQAPKDIEGGIFGQYAVDPRSMDDALIQAAVEMLDVADYTAMRSFLDERNKALEIWQEFYDYKGKESNQTKLYEGIIEKIDGKETGHLVGKYLSSFKEAEKKFYEEWEGDPPKQAKVDFYTKTKEKYINPQWTALQNLDATNPTKKMYNYLTSSFAEKDKMVPVGYSLAISGLDDKHPTYRLPSIEKSSVEALYEKGLFTATSDKFRQAFTRTADTTEFGEESNELDPNYKNVLVDEAGKENQTIPIHFRARHKDMSKQSYDLIGIHLMDHSQLLNYVEKSKIGHTLELIAEQAGERDVKKRENGKFLINAISKEKSFVLDDGINSNVYRALNSLIQDRLYGISTISLGDYKGININKAIDGVMAWTGNTMLMLNYMAAGVNLMQGKYQNFLEGAGKTIYTRKNLRNAEMLWTKDSAGILGDIGAKKPTSKTNLLVEKFNAFADFSGLKYRMSDDNKTKRLATTSAGHFMNHSAEAYIQGTLMYAVLDSTTVKDKDGNNIPIHEAYEIKDGNLVPKEGINITIEDEARISRKIKEVVKQLHGNYDHTNQAMAQRYVAGKMAFMLRKWMVVGTQRRWRGLKYALKDNQDRTVDDVAFNSILEKEMEGYYTTTARFLYNSRKELLSLKLSMVSGEWNKLTNEERANIRKTIIDAGVMMSSALAASILAGLAEGADDDDKDLYYTAAYLFRRHYSELRFYSHPGEGLKILSSPAASLSMIDRTLELINQLGNPTEQYVKGKRKGEYKIVRKLKRITPAVGQLDRNIRDVYNWLDQ